MELVQKNALKDNPALVYLVESDTDLREVKLLDSQNNYLNNIIF